MDTDEMYLDDKIYIEMAGEYPPERVMEVRKKRHRERVEDPDSHLVGPPELKFESASSSQRFGSNATVDGWVTFYSPKKLEQEEAFKHYTFPFRDVNKDDEPWSAFPDKENYKQHPIWKWQNPNEDPHENLTLAPSIGVGQPTEFHCFIRNGEIDWL